ncbi:TetR-like C-terminal domain-containing protein [Streptomyces libani]
MAVQGSTPGCRTHRRAPARLHTSRHRQPRRRSGVPAAHGGDPPLTTRPSSDIAVSVLGAATQSPELAVHIREFFADRIALEQPVFDRALARGELAPDTDTMLLVDLLAGAAWVRVVLRQLPLDKDFVSRAVGTVLNGALART